MQQAAASQKPGVAAAGGAIFGSTTLLWHTKQ